MLLHNNNKQNTLHCYIRVSSEEQISGHSLDVQEQHAKNMAKSLGYKCEIFREEGKSANYEDTINRPQLTKLLELCKTGNVTHIFVADIDRLSRNLRLVLNIETIFLEHNITIQTLSNKLDFEDPDQRFHTIMQSVFAEHENRKRVRKIKHSLALTVRKGTWIGVLTPYGYRKDANKILEIDPEEAEVYEKIVRLSLKGVGSNTIANEFNLLGIPTRGKKVLLNGIKLPKTKHRYTARHIATNEIKWAPNTITSIIKNSIYCGRRMYKGEAIYAPAIIDVETWEKLQVQHKLNKNHPTTQRRYFYLLKGKLRCGCCSRNLYGRKKPNAKNPEYYYLCSSKRIKSCGFRSISIPLLDTVVWQQIIGTSESLEHLLENLKGTDDADKLESCKKTLASLKRETTKLEKRKRNLLLLFETERIDIDTFDARQAEITEEIKQNQEDLVRVAKELENISTLESKLVETITEMDQIQHYLTKLDEQERQDIIHEVIENITVHWVEDFKFHIVNIEFNFNGIRYKTSKVIPLSPKSRKAIIVGGKTKPVLTVELVYSDASDYGLKLVGCDRSSISRPN